jgi:putative hydrolase of HD superfamily
MPQSRLTAQLQFIREVDRLKSVMRMSRLMDDSRCENSAEHSWHIALMAVVMAEHADTPVDVLHVVKMLLIHDIVEIDAGDTYAYDMNGQQDQHEREAAAARRIFGLLPEDQSAEFYDLWEEFEAKATPEARMANAVDRLMPLMHNLANKGEIWQTHGVTRPDVDKRMAPIAAGSTALWGVAESLMDDAVAQGYLAAE